MALRPWWSRTGVLVAGVILAAALGAWQAARLADALGFGPSAPRATVRGRPAARPDGATASATAGASGALPRPGARAGTLPSDRALTAGQALPAGPAADAPPGEQADGPAEPEPGSEAEAANRLAAEMRRFVEDLEYSPGLPEPRQQVVRPAPPAWRPPAGGEVGAAPEVAGISPGRGPAAGGTAVTLRGRHLRVVQVMFGAAPARISRAGPGEVVVVAPPGRAGPVRIAVTNADGTWAIVDQPFTYF